LLAYSSLSVEVALVHLQIILLQKLDKEQTVKIIHQQAKNHYIKILKKANLIKTMMTNKAPRKMLRRQRTQRN